MPRSDGSLFISLHNQFTDPNELWTKLYVDSRKLQLGLTPRGMNRRISTQDPSQTYLAWDR
eukprot:scaffold32620_cov55-Attheya_sp.AAC.5